MRTFFVSLALAACSSAPPSPRPPATAQPAPADAALDAAPDAGVPEAVANAPAWVFRYSTAQRTETWTLRYHEHEALLVVETAQGTQRYRGSATEGTALVLDVSTGTAKLALECKHARRPLSTKCNDKKAKPIEVLDCYHPDFKEPMPFGPAPGVEYVASSSCTGYRLVAP
ncbi:MAG TPA: hypothetical protein VFQ53_36410 [Kofleriaceae bacterium]|nr:hypothetical protein [Kofleriaceae bacterium]